MSNFCPLKFRQKNILNIKTVETFLNVNNMIMQKKVKFIPYRKICRKTYFKIQKSNQIDQHNKVYS